MENLKVKIGTVGKVFEFTITEEDGTTPVDLTGATVELIVERNATKTCTVVVGEEANGRADYEIVAGDYPTPGVYTGILRISDLPGGVVSWTENFEFSVEATPEPAT